MYIARGGQFINVPNQYPEEAWYHYDDWTCDYQCMAIEYFYWSIVANMGLLNDIQTCNGIYNEWELCTPELFQTTDIMMYSIIADPQYLIPQNKPDGNYCPSENYPADINNDGMINILDIIQLVNIVLSSDNNNHHDLNEDGILNILDIIYLVNIIQAK